MYITSNAINAAGELIVAVGAIKCPIFIVKPSIIINFEEQGVKCYQPAFKK